MNLVLFASAWAFGSVDACRKGVESGVFDGIESPVPKDATSARAQRYEFEAARIPWLAEICTGGDYAPPSSVSFAVHLSQLQIQLDLAAEGGAILASCLAGSDSWPIAQAIDFIGQGLEIGHKAGLPLTFETHRNRPTFNPWSTRDILLALPELRLTCDFSHWCVVCERLLDDDDEALSLAISRARHAHARVGYAQGPQVPDPRAPEYERELGTHEKWWSRIWDAADARGDSAVTMTPEFGPDGYLHHLPFTNEPVADLAEVNTWMARRQRERFSARTRNA